MIELRLELDFFFVVKKLFGSFLKNDTIKARQKE